MRNRFDGLFQDIYANDLCLVSISFSFRLAGSRVGHGIVSYNSAMDFWSVYPRDEASLLGYSRSNIRIWRPDFDPSSFSGSRMHRLV